MESSSSVLQELGVEGLNSVKVFLKVYGRNYFVK